MVLNDSITFVWTQFSNKANNYLSEAMHAPACNKKFQTFLFLIKPNSQIRQCTVCIRAQMLYSTH